MNPTRATTLSRILDGGIVAVVRSESAEPLVKAVRALVDGGVTAVEITFTVPDAPDVMSEPSAATRSGLVVQSSSFSSSGFCATAIATSCCSSSVDNCSSRMDCCSCGVSARCCDRRSWRLAFMARFYSL